MATITIKFKDELNYTSPIPSGDDDVTFNVTFICDNVTYSRIYINKDTISMSYDSSQIWDSRGWSNTNYQYITLDTNQTNFDAFITAMKDNIEGVLLESGTYVWNDVITLPTSISYYSSSLINFVSNNSNFTKISIDDSAMQYWIDSAPDIAYEVDNWYINAYKTITTSEDQYIDYDFYNYAILGNQLVKQEAEVTYTCKWYLDGTLVNTSTFTHEKLTGVDYSTLGSVFKVMLSAETLAQYDYGVNLNVETSNASLGSDNVITIEAFQGNITFNITSNGTTTLATKQTYVPSDIDFVVNVPSGVTEVSTSTEMDNKLAQANVGQYYKYTGTTDDKYTNGDIYQVESDS